MFPNRIICFTGILIVLTNLRPCQPTAQLPDRSRRAIDFPMQWRPVQSGSALNDHLISISSFDTTNKAQLAQIAHHNAHILRHIKRVPGVPVTQYLNPFPMFSSAGGANSPPSASGHPISGSSSIINHSQHSAGSAPSGPSAGSKHYIVQTSNIVVHPAPASSNNAYTSAPIHPAAHPNSLLTSSSNMAQTIVPFGHVPHKHQYFVSGAKQPTFLLGKPSELSNSAFKFLNSIHPTTTGKNVFSGLLKANHQPSTPFFSSTTSRIPIIRDSTLTPLSYPRGGGSTPKPHPVVNKLQSHLALAQRAKSPTAPHVDELAAHQSHLISSLAQFASVPNFIRTAEVAQKLPRTQQGPAFAPLPDHFGSLFGKNTVGNTIRFSSPGQAPPPNTMSSVQLGQQQQLRQQFVQQQHQQHVQQLKEAEQQKHLQQFKQQQKQQQPQQYHQQHYLQKQPNQPPQIQFQYNQQQQYHVTQLQQPPQNNQPHNFQNQQQQQHHSSPSQSQHQESYFLPPTAIGHNNQTRPVYEPNQSIENFDLPFKKMPAFENESSTRSPGGYLPPQPSVAPSVLSPFFQQVQQQQHQQDLDDQHEHEEEQRQRQQQHEVDERQREQDQNHHQHFYFSSTSAPEHHLEIRPSPPDEYYHPLHNQSHLHQSFQPETISFHHQHLDNNPHHHPPAQHIPPFNRIEDEFTLNLVPPVPSYPSHKDTSAFRRPSHGTRGPPATVVYPTADAEQVKAMEILNKYNIPAISPLQDANRYAYNARPISSEVPVTVSQYHLELPSPTQLTHFTTTKPNVFRQLNRPAESEYKQHKVMHPLYTGGPKRPGNVGPSFAAATLAPGRDPTAITHSFFTIEDAVTLSPQHSGNRHARPTSTGGIEANINRPREEEITEVITMRATSEDEELLQHLDVTTPKPSSSSMRTKHRRRRPRPSSTSTSTTEQVDDEENGQHEDSDQVQQGLWETNRFPSNHRETSAEPTPTTAKGTSPIPAPRHRTRNRGRPTVNQLPAEAIGLGEKQSNRSRRPTQRPEEPRPTLTTRSRNTQAPQTTETYDEPVTVDLRENIFLANLQQKRRPPHSTKSTVFDPDTNPPTTFSRPAVTTAQEDRTTRTTFSTTPVPTVEAETLATPRGTRPSILTTNNYNYQQTNAVEQETNANNDTNNEQEEMTLASETISNTIMTMAPTVSIDTANSVRSNLSSVEPSKFTSIDEVETPSLPVIVPNNQRVRQRLRLKEAYSNEILNIPSTTSKTTESSSKDSAEDLTDSNDLPDIQTYRPVSVRLPVTKESTTSRTSKSTSVENSSKMPTRQNAISKFDPKNRPRFSVKDYRQRLTVSSTSASASSTTTEATSTSSTTTRKYPTRSRVLPDLRIKTRTSGATSSSQETPTTTTSRGNSLSSEREDLTDDSSQKRFTPKERRVKPFSTASSNESYERSSRTTSTTPSPPVSGRTTRTRNPTSRRTFSSSTTTASSIESTVTRVPTIRKFPGLSLRRPPQPSLRQRIALSQQKKTSTETAVTLDPSLIGGGGTEATTISKLFNTNDGEADDSMSVENLTEDDFAGSTNTETYKMETAIMKIAKDDHSYRPYAHSSITPRTRTRTSSTAPPSATEPMNPFEELMLPDDDQVEDNKINVNSSGDMNGSPSEQSERVAELTRFGANQFQSVNTAAGGSTSPRRVPNYFTIATEDPILPIEAFFPKMNSGGGNHGK